MVLNGLGDHVDWKRVDIDPETFEDWTAEMRMPTLASVSVLVRGRLLIHGSC